MKRAHRNTQITLHFRPGELLVGAVIRLGNKGIIREVHVEERVFRVIRVSDLIEDSPAQPRPLVHEGLVCRRRKGGA